MSFAIGNREVGNGRCFIIGEVGLAHDGSYAEAHEFIAAMHHAGVDAVKFQCHLVDHEPNAPLRVNYWTDADRHQQWRRTAFTKQQWEGLAYDCRSRSLEFLCSPFSVEAVKLLDSLVPAWKVPSGEITNDPLLDAIRATGKPVLLSTGMADEAEYLVACSVFENKPLVLMQCTSMYPCPPEKIGLDWFAQRDPEPTGLSDHSGTIYAGLAAVTLGCDVLEVHVKLSEWDQGPDASSSLTPEKLKELVEGVRWIEKAKANPVDKDAMAKELEPMRRLFMKHTVNG